MGLVVAVGLSVAYYWSLPVSWEYIWPGGDHPESRPRRPHQEAPEASSVGAAVVAEWEPEQSLGWLGKELFEVGIPLQRNRHDDGDAAVDAVPVVRTLTYLRNIFATPDATKSVEQDAEEVVVAVKS